MAKPAKQVTMMATRLGKLRKEQARAVRKAGAFIAQAEALTAEIETADQTLQELMAAVRAQAAPDGTSAPGPGTPPRRRAAAPRTAPPPA